MATTPTTGDIPSNAAVDLKFNSEQFDRVMNSDDLTYTDRFGKKRITMKGVQELANGFQDTFTNLLGSPDGFKLIGGVKSFDTLRSTPVRTEGQRIFLKSYYENGNTGGGIFIGHIGTKLDDGGTVAQGVNFYWERATSSELLATDFGCLESNEDNRVQVLALLEASKTYNRQVVINGVFKVSSLTVDNFSQKISGSGGLIFTQRAGFVLNQPTGAEITELKLVFSGSGSTGLTINSGNKVDINKNTFSGHGRNGAVYVLGSSYINIEGNRFLEAAPDDTFIKSSSSDINIWGNNSFCRVVNNFCLSGGGYGVQIRSHSLGDVSSNHIISGNTISGYNSYGINCYRNKQTSTDTQVLSDIVITDNLISNITGDRPSDISAPTVLIFGSGIYLQGGERAVIKNNIINNVCVYSNNDLLAPAGIGVTNTGNVIVSDNYVTNSGMYGIKINDSVGLGDQYGKTIVANNTIGKVGYDGIMVQDRNNLSVIDNSIVTASRDGIKVIASPSATTKVTTTGKTISGNSVREIVGIGIYIEYTEKFDIVLNKAKNCSQGIVFQYSAAGNIRDNIVDGASVRGYYVHVTNTTPGSISFSENRAVGCTVDASIEHPIDYFNNPGITPSGTYAEGREIVSDLPNVTGVSFLNLKPSAALNFTGFSGGKIGQEVTIWVNNNLTTFVNSSTFMLSGLKNKNLGSNAVIKMLKTKIGWIEVGSSPYAMSYITLSSGQSYQIPDYLEGIYNQGSATLESATVTLPNNPVDGQTCLIVSQSPVTNFTLNVGTGQAVYPSATPTTLNSGTTIAYRYRLSVKAWYRYQ